MLQINAQMYLLWTLKQAVLWCVKATDEITTLLRYAEGFDVTRVTYVVT